jgi:glycine cleavage system regulatory protein
MTVIGRDRTGLVESIASLVAEHGGNWLESRMCRLGGEFAGILRVHLPPDREAAFRQALEALAEKGLAVVMRPDAPVPAGSGGRLASLEIVGHDRPGIVRQIAHVLARQGVNVEEFSSECASAPMSGEMLFKATARLHLPPHASLADLRAELEHIASDLLVDVSLTELAVATPAA